METPVAPQISSQVSEEHRTAAEDQLREALDDARIDVRIIESAQEAADASLLLDEVWNVTGSGTTVLEPSLFIALAHARNYTAAAFDRDSGQMLGVTVGFFAAPVGTSMHSHVAGVRHEAVGRGIGAAMKLHQRLWCLEHGLTRMTWTFDPLIARNAHFNIARLGARLVDYHEDFYGQMRDGVNAGQASDRAFVDWDLTDARPSPLTDPDAKAVAAVRIDDDGRPQELDVPREAPVVAVEIPSDIETLRATDPRLAAQWREAVRRGFVELLADGWRVSGFRRSGAYLLTHP
ncbi:hypothetical protein [Brevibacterium senegalense]|uniref:hypothetical protein n=1 Tax=Brevibacterium senegalense TaxID=1033736 RepID=UPI0002DB72FB|nr:hypothetical protein [Brevibacterium senegalense]